MLLRCRQGCLAGEVEAVVLRHVLVGRHLIHLCLELLLVGGNHRALLLDDHILAGPAGLWWERRKVGRGGGEVQKTDGADHEEEDKIG